MLLSKHSLCSAWVLEPFGSLRCLTALASEGSLRDYLVLRFLWLYLSRWEIGVLG